MINEGGLQEDIVIGSYAVRDSSQPPSNGQFELIADLDGPADPAEIDALLEALLLSAPEATPVELLARGAGLSQQVTEQGLQRLAGRTSQGWSLQRHAGKVQLVTSPRFSRQVRRFLGLEREVRLSAAALESLAIVAYQQPVTRADIEAVRGVDCSGVLSTLISRGLVDQTSRTDLPGQPYEYSVTPSFLRHFGMSSLDELPALGAMDGEEVSARLEETILHSRIVIQPDGLETVAENHGD